MSNNLAYLKKQVNKELQNNFISLINSCVEGYTGEWVPSDEGNMGFGAMAEDLRELAEYFNVDVSEAKEI